MKELICTLTIIAMIAVPVLCAGSLAYDMITGILTVL